MFMCSLTHTPHLQQPTQIKHIASEPPCREIAFVFPLCSSVFLERTVLLYNNQGCHWMSVILCMKTATWDTVKEVERFQLKSLEIEMLRWWARLRSVNSSAERVNERSFNTLSTTGLSVSTHTHRERESVRAKDSFSFVHYFSLSLLLYHHFRLFVQRQKCHFLVFFLATNSD